MDNSASLHYTIYPKQMKITHPLNVYIIKDIFIIRVIKDIPGPGSYNPLKSSFDMSAVPRFNRYIRPTFSASKT